MQIVWNLQPFWVIVELPISDFEIQADPGKRNPSVCGFLQIHSEFSTKIRHRLCCQACTAWKLSGKADSCHKSIGENFQYMFPFGCRIWQCNTESSLSQTSVPCITSGTISAATCGNTYITSCSLIIAVIRWVNYKLETNKWVKIILCLDSKNSVIFPRREN